MSLRKGHVFRSMDLRVADRTSVREDGCHEWIGRRDRHGYGRIDGPGRGAKPLLAHRYVWERDNGPVPAGLELDHLCKHKWCVNPEHLEAVTHRENMLRADFSLMVAHRNKTCVKGHPQGADPRHCKTCSTDRWRSRHPLEADGMPV